MMNANKIYIILIVILFITCKNNNATIDKSLNKVYSRDNNDTIRYNFNLTSNKNNDRLILIKQIEIGNNNFANYKLNYDRAYNNINKKKSTTSPAVRYVIKINNGNSYKTLFEIYSSDEFNNYIILEEGTDYKIKKGSNKFLRIIEKIPGKLDLRSLNFYLNSNYEASLLSKEKFTTENFDGYIGYCMDAITKHLNNTYKNTYEKEIYYNAAFDNLTCKWICNENIKID